MKGGEAFLDGLRTREVRDLYWILSAPGLLNDSYPPFKDRLISDRWFEKTATEAQDWFVELDRKPETLISDLAEKLPQKPLLGRYFEGLLSFWIRNYLRPGLFHFSVPIHENRQTIGEFDFLFKERETSQAQHWEAAVKFYLFCGDNRSQGVEMHRYLGTQVKDRLDLKISRIFEHQLKLTENPHAREWLKKSGYVHPRSHAWVKGMLFYPSHSDWIEHPFPSEVSPAHLRGWWTSIRELNVPVLDENSRWMALPKNRWLSPARSHTEGLLTDSQMRRFCQEHFTEHTYPLMWAELVQVSSDLWLEKRRGLVVFSDWLEQARHHSRSFESV